MRPRTASPLVLLLTAASLVLAFAISSACESDRVADDCAGTNPAAEPAGCSAELCPEGTWCPPDERRCVPSVCACEAGTWVCTADCGFDPAACRPIGADAAGDASVSPDAATADPDVPTEDGR